MLLINIIQETTSFPSPSSTGIEALLSGAVLWLVLIAEIVAAVFIGIGLVLTSARMLRVMKQPDFRGYEESRLTLARFLALGLEFQLAADVLTTAIAPSWTQIGKLAAIAVIRTALNYFLAGEIKGREISNSPNVDISALDPTRPTP
ncbi:MAG TPA: DUF1622 domain-containing protein [Pyrinomonadaceae bacterium]|nr:DUF1622 domain-containing protein [Pyrinomonadaceae bacterium]